MWGEAQLEFDVGEELIDGGVHGKGIIGRRGAGGGLFMPGDHKSSTGKTTCCHGRGHRYNVDMTLTFEHLPKRSPGADDAPAREGRPVKDVALDARLAANWKPPSRSAI